MDNNVLEGKWKQFRGKVREQWGKLTDDDLDRIAGKHDQLVGALQEKYGYTKERADREVKTFMDTLKEPQDVRRSV